MTRRWRVAVLTLAFGCWAAYGNGAGPITFDFENTSIGTFTPFTQTVNGVTATFSSSLDLTGPKFSVQSAATTGFVLSTFSGQFLYPNGLGVAPLTIAFSQPVTSISLSFATAEQHIASSMYLDAFLGSTQVGTTAGPNAFITGDTYPQGTVSYSGGPFDRVVLSVPAQGTEPAAAFFVDSIIVDTGGAVPPELKASWQFEEGVGQAATDTLGGNIGQLGSTPAVDVNDPAWVPGRSGTGLGFGASHYVEVPDALTLSPNTITVDAWVRAYVAQPAGAYLIEKVSAATCTPGAYGLRQGSLGGVEFVAFRPGGGELASPESSDIWDSKWHFVTGTFDGATARLFVDGQEVGTGTPAGTAFGIGAPFASDERLTIGSYVGVNCPISTPSFVGDIDQVGIWNGALSAQDVAARFAALNVPFATTTTLTSDAASTSDGDPVQLTADVWSNNGAPDGTVEFYDGASLLDTVPLTNGRAILVVTTLSVGTHTLSASFTPNGLCASSVSAPLIHTVVSAGPADTVPPTVTVPGPIATEATGPTGATVTFTASAVDNIDGPLAVTCAPASGVTFPLGTTAVSCSATDSAGNTGSASFSVTVRDTTPPAAPTWLPVTNVGPNTATLNWVAAVDSVGVHHYRIYEQIRKGGRPLPWQMLADGLTATSYTPPGFKQRTAVHAFRMVAVDASGNASNPSAELLVQLPKPGKVRP